MRQASLITLNKLNEEFQINYKRQVLDSVKKMALDNDRQACKISNTQLLSDRYLQTAWDSKKYSVSDNMQTSQANDFKQRLDNAPFILDQVSLQQ